MRNKHADINKKTIKIKSVLLKKTFELSVMNMVWVFIKVKQLDGIVSTNVL